MGEDRDDSERNTARLSSDTVDWIASERTLSPTLAGRFELASMLGRGGMGAVYRAWDRMLEEEVAVKVLTGRLDGESLSRLRKEVKLARCVTHANVVRTYDMGMHESTPFLTMELVEGESLSAILRRDGALALERFYRVARAICAGLTAAHAASVLHLDLKPANVLIGVDGRVAVTDFGVACRLGAGADGSDGTPAFMAPEQLRGDVVDARSDVYSLGVLFHVALTLRVPPKTASVIASGLPQPLALLVLRCLSTDPALRYPSAAEVLAELTKIAPPPSPAASAPASGDAAESSVLPTRRAGVRQPIGDAVALERYTLGRIAYHKVWPEWAREAVGHFDAAIERCPNDPGMLAAGALAVLRLHLTSGEPGMARARDLAARAAALAPDLPAAKLALAGIAISEGDEEAALAPLKDVLTLAPWLGEAHARIGELLADIGETRAAIDELMTARRLDPLTEEAVVRCAQVHALLGDMDACDALLGARSNADENLNMHAWRRMRTLLYDPSEARVARMRADLAGLDFSLKYVIEAVLTMVETKELASVLEGVLTQMTSPAESPRRTWFYTAPFIDALGYVGRVDDALTWLEHADRYGLIDLLWLDRAPTLSALRSKARYARLHDRVAERADRIRRAARRVGLTRDR